MKIKHVHSSDPGTEKIYDTEKSMKGCIGLLHAMGSSPTQEEWDKHELRCFKQNKERGLVLSYSIVKELDEKNIDTIMAEARKEREV